MNAELAERLDEAEYLPYGRAQIAAFDALLPAIDAAGDPELAYRARIAATTAYTHGGDRAKSFVTFSWCLAAHDRGEGVPDLEYSLLWQFKYMIGGLADFPNVSLQQTRAVLEDMAERYRRFGHSMNPVHQYRWQIAHHIGDREAADEHYRQWCSTPRGSLSDCIGCEPQDQISHLLWTGQDDQAAALCDSVLQKNLSCVEQPQGVLGAAAVPYLRQGRYDDAVDAHRRSYRRHRASRDHLASIGDHLNFCVLVDDPARGVEILQRHLGWLEEPTTPWSGMKFAATAAAALRFAADRSPTNVVVHRTARPGEPAVPVSAEVLAAELTAHALEFAAQFDARNGTTAQSERMAGLLAAEPWVGVNTARRTAARSGALAPAPAPVDQPDDPAAVASEAEHQRVLGNTASAAALWGHFDQRWPDPEGSLLGRRLIARGQDQVAVDDEGAAQLWQRALEHFEAAGDTPRVLLTRTRLGALSCFAGDEKGLAEIDAALAEIVALGNPDVEAEARLRHTRALGGLQRWDEAAAAVALAAEVGRRRPEYEGAAEGLRAHILASAATEQVPEEALQAVQHALRILAVLPGSGLLRETELTAAQIHAARGDLPSAEALLASAAETEDTVVRGAALHLRGRALTDLGRPAEALGCLRAARPVLADTGHPLARLDLDTAAAAMDCGEAETAATAAENAAEALVAIDDPGELTRARLMQARAYGRLGLSEQGVELLDGVVAAAERVGPFALGRVHAAAGDLLDQDDRDGEAAVRREAAADAYAAAEAPLEEIALRRLTAMSWCWARETETALQKLATADEVAASLVDEADSPTRWELAFLDFDAARILSNTEHDVEGAVQRAGRAAAVFQELGDVERWAAAVALRARLIADLGRESEAEEVLRAALAELPAEADDARDQLEHTLEFLTLDDDDEDDEDD